MKMKFLVAAVVIVPLLLGSCSSGSKAKEGDREKLRVKWEGEVRKSIKDPERAEKIIALGVRLDAKNRTLHEEIIPAQTGDEGRQPELRFHAGRV